MRPGSTPTGPRCCGHRGVGLPTAGSIVPNCGRCFCSLGRFGGVLDTYHQPLSPECRVASQRMCAKGPLSTCRQGRRASCRIRGLPHWPVEPRYYFPISAELRPAAGSGPRYLISCVSRMDVCFLTREMCYKIWNLGPQEYPGWHCPRLSAAII